MTYRFVDTENQESTLELEFKDYNNYGKRALITNKNQDLKDNGHVSEISITLTSDQIYDLIGALYQIKAKIERGAVIWKI